jgi:hypothetical protein
MLNQGMPQRTRCRIQQQREVQEPRVDCVKFSLPYLAGSDTDVVGSFCCPSGSIILMKTSSCGMLIDSIGLRELTEDIHVDNSQGFDGELHREMMKS